MKMQYKKRLMMYKEFEKLKEECGIFGGYGFEKNIAPYIKCGLLKLQHRGQESAGICCGDDVQHVLKGFGLVNFALSDFDVLKLNGRFGIGHVRYSSHDNDFKSVQPFKITHFDEDISLAYNGSIVQAKFVKKELELNGVKFESQSDSEVVLRLLAAKLNKAPSRWSFEEVSKCLNDNFPDGAYCLILFLKERIMAFRDSFGYRPLVLAKCKQGIFLASEDVAFSGLNVEKIIEIQPGQGIELTKEGFEIKAHKLPYVKQASQCVFEQIYFASSASNIFSKNVYQTRVRLGELLAASENGEFNCNDCVVIPVMDSGLGCAIGYAQKSGLPFHLGLVRNIWAERSFIQPEQKKREYNVRAKFVAVEPVVQGKRVILVDDSLVRGTTSIEIIKILKSAGAKEVHMRSVSPKIINTCFWGVDIPTRKELIAYNKDEKEIAAHIGANSLKFLTLDDLDKVFCAGVWCKKCFLTDKEGERCATPI